jgi:site-specific recombinase XerD
MEFLTPEEVLNVLREARVSTRDWFMILLAYQHGLRASEVVNLRKSDIKDGILTVSRLKGSKRTSQPITPHLTEPLLDGVKGLEVWLQERPDCGDVLFPSERGKSMSSRHFHRLFSKYATRAGINSSRCHPHILKHSFCTRLIRSGFDVVRAQMMLGHSQIASTLKYTHLNEAEVCKQAQEIMMR